ncbi:MAG: DUF362 domain-containing protein [Desulfobacterales bacterium]|nr:DUF362 domain-containing protein [Desulfobacterales bacterium]
MSKVLVMDSTYENCREAVEQAFAIFPVDVRGKRVAVKMNALKACDPDRHAMVTHYRLLQAVIAKLETLNPAAITVGDSVGTESYGNSEYVFRNSRLKEAAGPYYRNFNQNLTVVELDKPFKRKVAVLKDVLDADVYISVPKMKTHGLTMISGAIKNNYGLLTGGQKAWYHYHCVKPEKFAEIVIEMFRLRPPDLVIMDAILAMEGYGPASPETRWVNKVLASDDAAALDRVEAHIVGFNLEDVPYLCLARDLSLGETEMDRISVIGRADVIAEYHRPTPPESSYSYKAGVGSGRTSIDFYRQRVAYRPSISAQVCQHRQGCSACVDICPSGALSKGSDTPELDAAKCMLCSACREVCTYSGLELVPHEVTMRSLSEK